MPYHIETFDKPGHTDLRLKVRPVHLDFLEAHKDMILACGAKLDDAGEVAHGGVYIVDTDDRAEAERFISEDPFTHAGLFERIEITRWRLAYFDRQNRLTRAVA